jgi:hypothetical protein
MRQLAPGEKRRFFLEPLRESVGEVPETFSSSNVTSGSEREEQSLAKYTYFKELERSGF